ncbi:hypothetical protein [Sphingomonas sp. MMS24-J13]|uniref:hypothetical protein n=1 Tax=Sphingomonas sp. MMS24-J13 TaxID=3238686 RepID=UPI00384F2EC8
MFKTPSTINGIQWDANNYATRADVTGTTFGSEHRRELNKNRFNQIADYGADGRSVSFQYPNSDLTNPNNCTMDDFHYRAFNNQSERREGVLDPAMSFAVLEGCWQIGRAAWVHMR